MSNLNDLEARLETALSRIHSALAQVPTAAAQVAVDPALVAENAALKQELADMQDIRNSDLAELDNLIAQLKPLVEETN